MSEVRFHESQAVGRWHGKLAMAMPPVAVLFVTMRQILWNKPWGNPAVSNGGLVFLSVLAVLVYLRLITVRLVTDLRARELVVRLKGMWRKTAIPLEGVRAVKAVEYDALRDFGGYGIRDGQRGKAYIARGNQAVELQLKDGQRVFVGSQNADGLAKEIRAAR